jgi:hypothetical protein
VKVLRKQESRRTTGPLARWGVPHFRWSSCGPTLSLRYTKSPLPVEHLSYFSRDGQSRKRLLEEGLGRLKDTVSNHFLIEVAAHVQHFHVRRRASTASASSRPSIPGMTTSVSSKWTGRDSCPKPGRPRQAPGFDDLVALRLEDQPRRVPHHRLVLRKQYRFCAGRRYSLRVTRGRSRRCLRCDRQKNPEPRAFVDPAVDQDVSPSVRLTGSSPSGHGTDVRSSSPMGVSGLKCSGQRTVVGGIPRHAMDNDVLVRGYAGPRVECGSPPSPGRTLRPSRRGFFRMKARTPSATKL